MNCKECFYFVSDEHIAPFGDIGGRCFLNLPILDSNTDESVDCEVHGCCWVRPIVFGEDFCASFKGKNS